MNILLLAPHPFFQERGTPIAVDLLVRVLAKHGHRIDLLTYGEGCDRSYGPQVTILRIPPLRITQGIRPGFSLKKLICDLQMLPLALRLTRTRRYDVVHAVEEAVFLAMVLRRRRNLPYVFDMDSSMPLQIAESHGLLRPLMPLMLRCERAAIRNALAVMPMCDSLAELAAAEGARHVCTLRDISLLAPPAPATDPGPLRTRHGIHGLCFLYVGNLEKYQGIDLLLQAFARFRGNATPNACLAIAGGTPAHIGKYRDQARRLGIESSVRFLGPQPLEALGPLLRDADVLVSPRTRGTNTPMKIYSYLAAGRAILATNLPTHTQALSDESAFLAAPDPESFAQGMRLLSEQPVLREKLGANAARIAAERHSFESFARTVLGFEDWLKDRLHQPQAEFSFGQ